MEIIIKSNFRIIGMLHVRETVDFKMPYNEFMEIQVHEDRTVSCFYKVNISDELFYNLKSDSGFSGLSTDLKEELIDYLERMENDTYKVIDLVRYSLNENIFSEHTINLQKLEWKELSGEWDNIGDIRKIISNGHSYTPLALTKETAKIIQHNLDGEIEPFVGLRHLHKAKQEENPRFMWIEATIAAELAIKEFLIKLKPDLESILLELPSPPLTKLYGVILESYSGERYPDLKVLSKGIEIRNRLVHRPLNEEIDYKKAIKYVEDIESAIFYLLKKLYPNDLLIDRIVNPPLKIETSVSYISESE
ncbi:hypothetical protein [Virgibacillus litoralis]|uniref:Apea-like HEPN domain-containing protein n=1 Tax=Virgibacillus litoralis TaxID=578221 RepID=A0ABS4HIF2_9BACI|nr:hypothetical protein [Virgibacillus litoralis]MBP1950697.1 hypothetical protein [Virgibacillus litoralis]